jgi:hypothetical protein
MLAAVAALAVIGLPYLESPPAEETLLSQH